MDKTMLNEQKERILSSEETNKKGKFRKKYTDDDVRLIITNIDKYNNIICDHNKIIASESVILAGALFITVFNAVTGITDEKYRFSRLILAAIWAIISTFDVISLKDRINSKNKMKKEYKNYLESFDLELVEKPKRFIKRK